MSDFRVTYEVKDAQLETLLPRVFSSLYLAEIEGVNVRLTDITHGGEFDFPATQRLIKHLNEQPAPPAEGDWALPTEDHAGEDV